MKATVLVDNTAWPGLRGEWGLSIYIEYGDKIVLAVKPDDFDVEHSTEEEQRQAARAYAEAFCNPDRPTMFAFVDGGRFLTPAFQEELYRVSRQRYSGVAI